MLKQIFMQPVIKGLNKALKKTDDSPFLMMKMMD